MTVQELIDKLQAMPDKTLEVWLADNDCCKMKATDARVIPIVTGRYCVIPDIAPYGAEDDDTVVGYAVYIDD
jgi:hypothetical protein